MRTVYNTLLKWDPAYIPGYLVILPTQLIPFLIHWLFIRFIQVINSFPTQDFYLNPLVFPLPSGLNLHIAILQQTRLMNCNMLLDIHAMIHLERAVPRPKEGIDCLPKVLFFFQHICQPFALKVNYIL